MCGCEPIPGELRDVLMAASGHRETSSEFVSDVRFGAIGRRPGTRSVWKLTAYA